MFSLIKSFVFKHKSKFNLNRPMHWTFLNELIVLPVSSRSALCRGHLALWVWSWVPLNMRGERKKSAGSGDACTETVLVFQQPCRPAGCHLARLLSFRPPLGVFLRLPIPEKSSLHNKLIERNTHSFCFFVGLQSLMLYKIKKWPQYVVFSDSCL